MTALSSHPAPPLALIERGKEFQSTLSTWTRRRAGQTGRVSQPPVLSQSNRAESRDSWPPAGPWASAGISHLCSQIVSTDSLLGAAGKNSSHCIERCQGWRARAYQRRDFYYLANCQSLLPTAPLTTATPTQKSSLWTLDRLVSYPKKGAERIKELLLVFSFVSDSEVW